MAKDVKYFVPESLEEALHILGGNGLRVSVLAGGTDLVRDMNLGYAAPEAILWIGNLGLEYIWEEGDTIRIGGATRMQTAGSSDLLWSKATALAQAAAKLASPPVRSLATLGGNICTASPAGDTVCAMLGLGAEVVLTSAAGQRIVPLQDVFVGPGETVIRADELLTEIRIKATGEREGSAYVKQGRRQALTLAVLNASARVRLDAGGNCVSAIIAVGAAAPTPLRISRAEQALVGKPYTEDAIREAARIASEDIKPIDDVHGTAWYRRKLANVLVARVLRQAGGLQTEG